MKNGMKTTTHKGLTFAQLQEKFQLRDPQRQGLWVPRAGPFQVRHVVGNPVQSIEPGAQLFCSMVTTNSRETTLKVHATKEITEKPRTTCMWIDADRFELV